MCGFPRIGDLRQWFFDGRLLFGSFGSMSVGRKLVVCLLLEPVRASCEQQMLTLKVIYVDPISKTEVLGYQRLDELVCLP